MLTDNKIKSLKFKKEGKNNHADRGDGLFVSVLQSGKKVFRFDFRFEGKKQRLTYGTYPEISLKDARIAHDEARSLIAAGTHPKIHEQQQIIAQRIKD